ncbi:MAG TPA: hypothetical protein DHL02_12765 [Achromobacter sp.]|nr:hypothetical protein [Achromobacter sp.]
MGLLTAFARYTLGAGQSLPKQVFGKQQRSVIACATGKVLKTRRKAAAITRFDRATKGGRQRFKIFKVKVYRGLVHLLFQGQLRKEAA